TLTEVTSIRSSRRSVIDATKESKPPRLIRMGVSAAAPIGVRQLAVSITLSSRADASIYLKGEHILNLKPIMRVALCAAIVALSVAGMGFPTQSVAGQESNPGALEGAAAIQQLKKAGQYDALQAEMNRL